MTGLFSLLFASLMLVATAVAGEDAFASMVRAELDFAGMAAEKGTQAAFLQYLAEPSVLFAPRPVNGKAWLTEHPMSPGLLSWRPAVAGVSQTGDLGFSTGPWEYRRTKDSEPVAFGRFLTIWKKQTDGSWKAVLDTGVDSSGPNATVLEVRRVPGVNPQQAGQRESRLDALSAADRETWTSEVFNKSLRSDSVLLREDSLPETGREKHLTRDGADVSAGGDFGYTFGTYQSSDQIIGTYVRVWQYDGSWKITVDLRKPDPKKP